MEMTTKSGSAEKVRAGTVVVGAFADGTLTAAAQAIDKASKRRLSTVLKRGDLAARRRALSLLPDKDVVKKLFDELAPRYVARPGGYVRITKLGPRQGDGAEMVKMELVEE